MEEREGVAYRDAVNITLDDIEEYTLAVCKEYNISYEYAVEHMAYTDIGVLYAKMANNKAFSSYNDYLQLDDKAKGKHVVDYGEVKPFVFQLVTAEDQQKHTEDISEVQQKLKSMYKRGGNFND